MAADKKQKYGKTVKKIAVFDVDGVLLCSLHRYRTILTKKGEKIDLDHWRENEKRLFNDSILPTALLYEKMLERKNTFVIIATSRILKADDYAMIESTLGFPDSIVSRLNNKQKGADLKIQGMQKVINDCNLSHIKPANITIYEDNIHYLKSFCDFFRCNGIYIPSFQGH